LLQGPPMKERLLQWFIFVIIIASLVGGEKSNSKDDEDDSYDLRTNDVDDQDEATTRMLDLINNAALKIVDASELGKVTNLFNSTVMFPLFLKCQSF